jgi:hypothetical protein
MADQGKPLARRAAENYIDFPAANPGYLSQLRAGHVRNRLGHHGTTGKIELVNGRMNRIDLNRCHHIKASLLETQAQASGTCE